MYASFRSADGKASIFAFISDSVRTERSSEPDSALTLFSRLSLYEPAVSAAG